MTLGEAGTYTIRMLLRCLTVVASALSLAALSWPAPLRAQVGPREHAVFVSALDSKGVPVTSLDVEDVVIREDRQVREAIRVVPALEPMDVVILVDNSQAAASYIRDYRVGLTSFIEAMAADETGARHQYSIVTVAERPTINTNYTLDPAVAIAGVQRLFNGMSGSGSYLMDGIVEVSQGLKRRMAARVAIVAISSDGPDLTNRAFQQVLAALKEGGASLHVLTIGRQANMNEDRAVVFGRGTQDTGGRNENVLVSQALGMRLKQVAAELTHQFKVVYVRPESLLKPERITIESGRKGLTVRGIVDRERQER